MRHTVRYLKTSIAVTLAGFTAYLCLWPMADEVSWIGRFADPMVQPLLTILGIFAIIVMVTSVLSQL